MGRIGPGLTSMAMCSCMLTRGGRPPAAAVPAMGTPTGGGDSEKCLRTGAGGGEASLIPCRGPEDRAQGWGRGRGSPQPGGSWQALEGTGCVGSQSSSQSLPLWELLHPV